MKKFVIYSLIIGFLLSYNMWESPYIGTINLVFASLFTFLNFLLFQKILQFIGNHYGINVNLDRFIIKKEIKYFSHIKKDVVTKIRFFPLDYFLTLFFGILTYGSFFPILLTIRYNIIESKRYGKTKDFDIKYEEKIKIIFYSILSFWLFISVIKYFVNINPVLQAYFTYTFRFLLMLTLSMILPFNLLLSYIVIKKFGYEYLGVSPGDILIFTKIPLYKAIIISIIFLPIFSLFLDPFSLIIIILFILGVIWLREKYRELIA